MRTLLNDVVINLVDVRGFDELGRVLFERGEPIANARNQW
jgi:hypothetical protein